MNPFNLRLVNVTKSSPIILALAASEETHPESLESMARHRHYGIRAAVAANLATPAETISRLTADKVKAVRLAAIGNRNIPLEVWFERYEFCLNAMQASMTFFPRTISAVLSNAMATDDQLFELASCLFYGYAKKGIISVGEVKGNKFFPGLLRKAIQHPNLSEESLSRLEAKHAAISHVFIADNCQCPASILNMLGKMSRVGKVLRNVLRNPNTPTSTLEYLYLHSPHSRVRAEALRALNGEPASSTQGQ